MVEADGNPGSDYTEPGSNCSRTCPPRSHVPACPWTESPLKAKVTSHLCLHPGAQHVVVAQLMFEQWTAGPEGG